MIPYYTLTVAVGGQVYSYAVQVHNEGFYIYLVRVVLPNHGKHCVSSRSNEGHVKNLEQSIYEYLKYNKYKKNNEKHYV